MISSATVGCTCMCLWRIDMVEREPGCAERLELRTDLAPELARGPTAERKTETRRAPCSGRSAIAAQEPGDLAIRQHMTAVDQHEMQADTQPRQAARARHRVGRGGGADHQAGGGQDAVPVRLFDRLVDRGSSPKSSAQTIERAAPDGARHLPARAGTGRTRRLRAGGGASSRGLLIISATSEAIFRRRK